MGAASSPFSERKRSRVRSSMVNSPSPPSASVAGPGFSYVCFHGLPVLAHPVAPPFGLARVHQQLESLLRLFDLLRVELHAHQAPRIRIHRGFPELLGIHLPQALEARDFPGALLHL